MKFFRVFIAAALALGVVSASAATVTARASWTAPATYADEARTPLPATDIVEYRIYFAVDENVPDDRDAPHIKVVSGTSRVVSVELTPRLAPYTVRFGVRVVANNGGISELSNIASASYRVQTTANPSAATDVRFELNCSVGCTMTLVE